MTILDSVSKSSLDQLTTVSWRAVAGGIWVATGLTSGRPAGIVSERQRGVFSVVSATGTDLGSRRLLVDALETLEEHLANERKATS